MGIDSTGGHGVDVALAQHDVVVAPDFDLVPVFRTEQHTVTDLGATNVLSEGHDFGPHESLRQLCGGRDEDAAAAPTLPFLVGDPNEEAVVEHLDRKLLLRFGLFTGGHGGSRYRRPVAINTVTLTTIDGVELVGDFRSADGPLRGSVALAHPHPLYGGDRFNPVVGALFDHLPTLGFHCLRFDFRGAGASSGEHDDGDSERLDVAAAVDFLTTVGDDQAWIAGYSFGSIVGLNVIEPRVCGWIAIAPPLAMAKGRVLAADDPRRKLVLAPAHDQFTDPEDVVRTVAQWNSGSVKRIEAADHFLMGHTASVARSVGAWLVNGAESGT